MHAIKSPAADRSFTIVGNFNYRLNVELAGTGTVCRKHGSITCSAVLGATQDISDAVYATIEAAIQRGETSGTIEQAAADAGKGWNVTYEWSVE